MASQDKAEEWIDRTNEALGEIGNGYELTPTLQHLYLTNNRISKIEKLSPCLALRELVLRQNSIKVIEGIDALEELEELDLYMNQIDHVPSDGFKKNSKLKRLDLSFNDIRELKGFPSNNLPNLEELYLIGNKIRVVSDLQSMPKLVMLELGDNRLRVIENLDRLPSLQGLWLGRNKITRIEGLQKLTKLRRLSIQSNRITCIEGLEHLEHLEELYLSHNGITSMQGIQSLKNIQVLDLGVNFIEHIECIENLSKLREFWMNGNKLSSFDELNSLRSATRLETVYLEANPLAKDPQYQAKALEILPTSLEQLDALLLDDVRKQIAAQSCREDQAAVADKPEHAAEESVIANTMGGNLMDRSRVIQIDGRLDRDSQNEVPADEPSRDDTAETVPSRKVASEHTVTMAPDVKVSLSQSLEQGDATGEAQSQSKTHEIG